MLLYLATVVYGHNYRIRNQVIAGCELTVTWATRNMVEKPQADVPIVKASIKTVTKKLKYIVETWFISSIHRLV